MWLLSTDRAELHYFARNFDAEGGYAILSHTWDGNEQSLQEVRAIGEQCQTDRTNPRDDPKLSPKIRECCILAERHGYRWVWIDSCCIDKRSSSELSEAINSMYKWYQSSEVCYAYLKDVPSGDKVSSKGSAFRKSRWHTRGWTLQELIAPDSVIFLSVDWRELGTRAELALLLQKITRVPFKIMLGAIGPEQYSACIRMAWASRRKTTRIEDEAYCLMGLFGVSMPTNYGEGKRAFLRLQYEIMQHKECDMSLFAFGEPIMPGEIIHDGIAFASNEEHIDRDNPWRYLLAYSPRPFGHIFTYVPDLGSNAVQQYPPPLDSTTAGPFDSVELPHATITSYGVQFRLPVATVNGVTLAVILCEGGNRHFGLFLTKDDRAKDRQWPRYFVGRSYTRSKTGSAGYLARLCDLGDDLYKLTFNGETLIATWSTIYIIPTASDTDSRSATSPNLSINCNPYSRFRLPRWLVDRFIGLHFEVDEVVYSDSLQVVSFVHRSEGRIYMCLGTCEGHNGIGKPPMWAKLFVETLVNPKAFTHDCSEDHLDSMSWATRSRTFGDSDRTVRLSFLQSLHRLPQMARATIIHLELSGRVFEDSVLQEAGTSIPPVANPNKSLLRKMPDTLIFPSPPGFDVSHIEMLESDDTFNKFLHVQSQHLLTRLEEDFPGLTSQRAPVTPSQPEPSFPQIETLGMESLRRTPNTPNPTISLQLQELLGRLEEDFPGLSAHQTSIVPASQPGPYSP